MSKPYVGDIGTVIRLRTGIDLTGYTSHSDPGPPDPHTVFKVKKPDGSETNWVCDVEGSPTAGILYHETADGDLDQAGNYKIQALVVFDPDQFLSETITIQVYQAYE